MGNKGSTPVRRVGIAGDQLSPNDPNAAGDGTNGDGGRESSTVAPHTPGATRARSLSAQPPRPSPTLTAPRERGLSVSVLPVASGDTQDRLGAEVSTRTPVRRPSYRAKSVAQLAASRVILTPGALPPTPTSATTPPSGLPAEHTATNAPEGGPVTPGMAPVGAFVLDGVLYENAEEFWGVNSRQGLSAEEKALLHHLIRTAIVPVADGDGDDAMDALFPKLPPMTPRATAPHPGAMPHTPHTPHTAHTAHTAHTVGDTPGVDPSPASLATGPQDMVATFAPDAVASAPAVAPPQPPASARLSAAEKSAGQSAHQARQSAVVLDDKIETAQQQMEEYIGGSCGFRVLSFLGRGAYGAVFLAQSHTGERVAIKHVAQSLTNAVAARRIFREVSVMRHFRHPNIISLRDVLRPADPVTFQDMYLVQELMESDLHKVIRSSQTLTSDHIAFMLYQLLCALNHLHSAGVLHRDLKPSNLLVDAQCELKVADFGLARETEASNSLSAAHMTEYVVTRWYRAPEVLLSVGNYTEAMDVWAAGCVYMEMLMRRPIFPGKSYLNQLQLICSILGSPTVDDLHFVKPHAARTFMLRQPQQNGVPFAELCPHADACSLDLAQRMLQFDPDKRITVAEALQHPFLARVRSKAASIQADHTIPRSPLPPGVPDPVTLRDVMEAPTVPLTMGFKIRKADVAEIKRRFVDGICGGTPTVPLSSHPHAAPDASLLPSPIRAAEHRTQRRAQGSTGHPGPPLTPSPASPAGAGRGGQRSPHRRPLPRRAAPVYPGTAPAASSPSRPRDNTSPPVGGAAFKSVPATSRQLRRRDGRAGGGGGGGGSGAGDRARAPPPLRTNHKSQPPHQTSSGDGSTGGGGGGSTSYRIAPSPVAARTTAGSSPADARASHRRSRSSASAAATAAGAAYPQPSPGVASTSRQGQRARAHRSVQPASPIASTPGAGPPSAGSNTPVTPVMMVNGVLQPPPPSHSPPRRMRHAGAHERSVSADLDAQFFTPRSERTASVGGGYGTSREPDRGERGDGGGGGGGGGAASARLAPRWDRRDVPHPHPHHHNQHRGPGFGRGHHDPPPAARTAFGGAPLGTAPVAGGPPPRRPAPEFRPADANGNGNGVAMSPVSATGVVMLSARSTLSAASTPRSDGGFSMDSSAASVGGIALAPAGMGVVGTRVGTRLPVHAAPATPSSMPSARSASSDASSSHSALLGGASAGWGGGDTSDGSSTGYGVQGYGGQSDGVSAAASVQATHHRSDRRGHGDRRRDRRHRRPRRHHGSRSRSRRRRHRRHGSRSRSRPHGTPHEAAAGTAEGRRPHERPHNEAAQLDEQRVRRGAGGGVTVPDGAGTRGSDDDDQWEEIDGDFFADARQDTTPRYGAPHAVQ